MLERLQFVDAQALLVCPVNRPGFLVEEIIPHGVHLLCGDEEQAKLMEKNFRLNAENLYQEIAEMLSKK